MRVNHLIIGCRDVFESASFYKDLFGFSQAGEFTDTGTGMVGLILHRRDSDADDLDLMLVPFKHERLPNPQHVALETDEQTFNRSFETATSKGLKIRAEPSLKSEVYGIGRLDIHDRSYRIFYVLDPGGVNVELMTKVKE